MTKNNSYLERLGEAVQRHVAPHRHSALLVTIVVVFMARPLLGNWAMGPIVYSIAAVAVLLVSLYTIQIDELVGEQRKLTAERRRRSAIGWALASLATRFA